MGRYNQLGEWKPYTVGGDEAFAKTAARDLSGYDLAAYSAFFYVFYTGFHVIEFAAATTVELPEQQIDLVGGRCHLWKCPPVYPIQNEVVYDGWWDLPAVKPDAIQGALASISQILNRLAFTFRSAVRWRPKYSEVSSVGSYATPDIEDFETLGQHLSLRMSAEENAVLDAAIDWYNRARLARNPFATYLSYYIPLEVVSLAVGSGMADFGIGSTSMSKSERRAAREECIRGLHDELYQNNPIAFVERSYFDCIGSITRQVHTALDSVFGEESEEAANVLMGTSERPSLMDLRGRITHGGYSLSDPAHVSEVRQRTSEMASICRAFLTRLILGLGPDDALPRGQSRFRAGFNFKDPRDLHMANPDVVESGDWRIRPEWCREETHST